MAEYQKVCVICGSQFVSKQIRTSYCSQTCRQTAYRTGKTTIKKNSLKITDEQLSQAIDDGLSRQEIADKYGMHVESIAKRMQRIGKYATGGDQLKGLRENWGKKNENLFNNTKYGECWHYVSSQALRFNKKHPNFEYLETKNVNHVRRIRLKCKKCGAVIEKAESTARTKNIRCDNCYEKEKQQKELKEQQLKLTKLLYALKESKTPKECACCGSIFYSVSPNAKYCSDKCKKAGKGYRSRCKKYGVYYDSSVTLKKVIDRDHNICKICGQPCDTKSLEWGSLGAKYPTIDHIKPLSKGGTHTWNNVQLAHAICNSYKRDLDDSMDIKEAVSNAKIQTA